VQLAVLRALGTLGDARAIASLETFASAGEETPQRPVAEAAIRQIRQDQPQSAEVGALRDEVIELQQRNRDLKSEFETFKKQMEAAGNAKPAGEEPKKKRGWFSFGRD
jgi:hypothetical protein